MLSLGAINKITGEYTHPKFAKKTEQFICPECKKDLILCQGAVRIHHYRHKVDSIHPCNHYNNPGETALHKDAKELMKTILTKCVNITMKRRCSQCSNHTIPIDIKTQNDNTSTELEYRFNHSGNPKIADVVYLQNGEIKYIFEICNTHKTKEEDRPEPWFEIDAYNLIKSFGENSTDNIYIDCLRPIKCSDCITIYNKNICEREIIKNKIRIAFGANAEPKVCCNYNFDHISPGGYYIYKLCCGVTVGGDEFGLSVNHLKSTIYYSSITGPEPNEYSCENCVFNSRLYNNMWDASFTTQIISKIKYIKIIDKINNSNIVKNNMKIIVKFNENDWFIENGVFYIVPANIHYDWNHLKPIKYSELIQYKIKQFETFDADYHSYEKTVELFCDIVLSPNQMIYLKVSYNDKDKIKNIGGKWDMEQKLWYVSQNIYSKNEDFITSFCSSIDV